MIQQRFRWFPRKKWAKHVSVLTFLLVPSRNMRVYQRCRWFPREKYECISCCVGSLVRNANVLLFSLIPSPKKQVYKCVLWFSLETCECNTCSLILRGNWKYTNAFVGSLAKTYRHVRWLPRSNCEYISVFVDSLSKARIPKRYERDDEGILKGSLRDPKEMLKGS